MTDMEKVQAILNRYKPKTFEDLVGIYISAYEEDFSASRLIDFVEHINSVATRGKVRQLERIAAISRERATYLKCYLSGNMYETEQAAKANVDIQISNAQAILDACKGAKE